MSGSNSETPSHRGWLSYDGPLGWVYAVGVALLIALAFRWAVAEPFRIPSSSMEPTLHGDEAMFKGDRVFVNKWIYGLRVPFTNKRLFHLYEPQRFDIVVFNAVADDAEHPILIKRVIGLPGERIQIRNGWVYVNGEPMEVPERWKKSFEDIRYTSPLDYNTAYRNEGPNSKRFGILPEDEFSLVPPDHYLVLGDNSPVSQDGRVFGWLPNDHILGRAACIWWPVDRWRDFSGFSGTLWWWTFLTLLAMYIVWRMFLGRSYKTYGEALGPEFAPTAHLYIDRAAFGVPVPMTRIRLNKGRMPQRGEVIVYYAKVDGEIVILVGQVAARPGDLTAMHRDVAPPDSIVESERERDDEVVDCVTPPGHYFVVSHDGRSMPDSRTLGFVCEKDLVGAARAIWWPPRRMRFLK